MWLHQLLVRAEACTQLKFHLDSKALHKNFKYVGAAPIPGFYVDTGPIPVIFDDIGISQVCYPVADLEGVPRAPWNPLFSLSCNRNL